jgi:hypothetical protein
MFEIRVLRRVFGPQRDEVMGGWRRRHIEEVHNLYALPCVIEMIGSRCIRLAGHIA